MERMVLITAETGEYDDKCKYEVFVCRSMDAANVCLRAIDNWFGLQGIQRTINRPGHYSMGDKDRHKIAEAFLKQFDVYISIDYTGIEFDRQFIEVFNESGA